MTEWLEIGRIVAPQGLRGEVRIYPNSDFPERFIQPGKRWLRRSPAAEPETIELLAGRLVAGKDLYVVKLAGIGDRQQAEALRNAVLMVPASDRLPLEPGEFHVADLIGLRVIDQASQAAVGTIVNLFSAGHDLLEVALSESVDVAVSETAAPAHQPSSKPPRPPQPKTVLIPFVEAIVPVVNLEQGYVEIVPPAGLL